MKRENEKWGKGDVCVCVCGLSAAEAVNVFASLSSVSVWRHPLVYQGSKSASQRGRETLGEVTTREASTPSNPMRVCLVESRINPNQGLFVPFLPNRS